MKVSKCETLVKFLIAPNLQSKGNSGLGLTVIDPMIVETISIFQDAGPISINAQFRNVTLTGLSKAKVYKVSGFKKNPQGNILEIHFKTPLASAVGPYKMSGKILILPLDGEGNMKLNFGNIL